MVSTDPQQLDYASSEATQESQFFVQAIGETVLPVIPHADDYLRIICTSIAFRPIRFPLGTLFASGEWTQRTIGK